MIWTMPWISSPGIGCGSGDKDSRPAGGEGGNHHIVRGRLGGFWNTKITKGTKDAKRRPTLSVSRGEGVRRPSSDFESSDFEPLVSLVSFVSECRGAKTTRARAAWLSLRPALRLPAGRFGGRRRRSGRRSYSLRASRWILEHEEHQEHEGREGREEAVDLERLARIVVDAGLKVHRTLGPGLLESAYEHCLARELQIRGLAVRRQVALPIVYEGAKLESGYRLDLVIDDALVIEVKAVEALTRLHEAQVLTYLRLSGHRIGFLMNFNVTLFKQGVRRLVF